MSAPSETPVRLLIVNPNTSMHMTEALRPVVDALGFSNVQYTYFTCPSPGISSINSPEDATKSADICMPHLVPLLSMHDAFLIACYSQHPLVSLLQEECSKIQQQATKGFDGSGARKYVTGIFEASIAISLSLVGSQKAESFGIVSTGKVWETSLKEAVQEMLGAAKCSRFAGCWTTGLNASELHDLPQNTVCQKMEDATEMLLQAGEDMSTDVTAICLGCAGMVGLETSVRKACIDVLGEEKAKKVAIVDGVKAGVGILLTQARSGF